MGLLLGLTTGWLWRICRAALVGSWNRLLFQRISGQMMRDKGLSRWWDEPRGHPLCVFVPSCWQKVARFAFGGPRSPKGGFPRTTQWTVL